VSSRTPKLRVAGSLSVKRGAAPIGRLARATVLFADLRGYTGLAERLPPAQLVPLLDEFFGVLAKAATMHGGTVFHMAGDGIMAGFGGSGDPVAGVPPRDGAREALAAGNAMLKQFGLVAARWREELSIDAGIGVGLHMGEVAVGFIGPPGQKFTTLVGDTVNVAARLCSRARAGEVLLSCSVAEALDIDDGGRDLYVGPIPVLQLPQYALRGRSAPMDIWCVPALERLAF
jgi:adenylate cyclase